MFELIVVILWSMTKVFDSTEDMWKCYITFCLERYNRKTNSEELKQKVKSSLGNHSPETTLFLLAFCNLSDKELMFERFIRNSDK